MLHQDLLKIIFNRQSATSVQSPVKYMYVCDVLYIALISEFYELVFLEGCRVVVVQVAHSSNIHIAKLRCCKLPHLVHAIVR